MKTKIELQNEIDGLTACEVHMETNQGTYGASEACRKVGSGDPYFANREVYQTVGGQRREIGPDQNDAPGRMRSIGHEEMAEKKSRLADLKKQLRAMK